MQVWFNGRTSAFQAEYVGSIPITCFTKYPQDKPEGIFENKLYYFLLSVAYCFCYFGSSACSGRISFSEFAYFSAGFASVTIIASPMSANLTVLISPNFS